MASRGEQRRNDREGRAVGPMAFPSPFLARADRNRLTPIRHRRQWRRRCLKPLHRESERELLYQLEGGREETREKKRER